MKDDLKELEGVIMSSVVDDIEKHKNDDSYFTERLKEYTGKGTNNNLAEIISVDADALQRAIYTAFNFSRLADLYATLVSSYRKELLEVLKDPEFSERSPEEWLALGFAELYKDPLFDAAIQKAIALREKTAKLYLPATPPKSHSIINNPLMDKLQKNGANVEGGFNFSVGKNLYSFATVNFVEGQDKLTEYQRQVCDAVTSLYLAALDANVPSVFIPEDIFRAMPGGGEDPSPQQIQEIRETMDVLRSINIEIDATDEVLARGLIQEGETYKPNDYCLNFTELPVKARTGGYVKIGYRINYQPILLEYATLTNQILRVPAEVLTIKKVTATGKKTNQIIPMTSSRQAIAGYLIRRITQERYTYKKAKDAWRKYEKSRVAKPDRIKKSLEDFRDQKQKNADRILFSTVFEVAGLTENGDTISKEKAYDCRKFCLRVLDYQKAIGYLKDYEILKDGRNIKGVKLIVGDSSES